MRATRLRIALLTLLSAGFLAGVGVAQGNNVRMWKSAQGKEMEMQFLRMDGEDHCMMRTRDGKTHRFALSLLAEADQKVARSMKAVRVETGANRGARDSAALIDRLINQNLAKQGGRPNEPATDEEFVRRVYLDTIGRIPNLSEAREFIASDSPNKRNELIDKLMDSEGYKAHLYNYFADMLRLRTRLNNDIQGTPYIQWIKKCIDEGKPYNNMVYEMLTASGKIWENPATGYLLRDSGMALDNLANTTSVFLGTEIACAQCHDHPFYDDTWTQSKFYEMASFFGSTVTQLGYKDFKNGDPRARIKGEITKLIKSKGVDPESRQVTQQFRSLDNMIRANRNVVRDIENNRLRIPHDYKYNDYAPNAPVDPKFIEWPDVRNVKVRKEKGMTDRQLFARWLTHPENPMFAKVIANRMWQRAFGLGVVEPVDNLFDPAMDSNPQLLTFLGQEMVRSGFNLKQFQRTIFYTQAYQNKATTTEHELGTDYAFQGPVLRRMSAEQLWDSYMTLAVGNPDVYKGDDGELYGRAVAMELDRTTGLTALQKLEAFNNLGRTRNKMTKGGSLGDAEKMMSDDSMMGGGDSMMMNTVLNHGGLELLRASELGQPASAGHFLSEFGQSDRLLFDANSTEGTVPQVLRMMNGKATSMLTNYQSLIFKNMDKEETDEKKVEAVFLSVLTRTPTEKDAEVAAKEIADNGRSGYSTLIWALINTREFMFIQ